MLKILAPFYIFIASNHWKIVRKLVVINYITEEYGPFCLFHSQVQEVERVFCPCHGINATFQFLEFLTTI